MRYAAFFLSLFLSLTAFGDTWFYKPEVSTKRYTFGATEIELIIDTTSDPYQPDFTLKIFTNSELQAIYRGISFQFLAADKSNSTFVGLSNEGIPGTAVVMFGSHGQLKKLVNHFEFSPHYCRHSVTIRKEWVNSTDPKIEFIYDSADDDYSYIEDISFLNCRNERKSLFSEIRKGFEQKGLERKSFESDH